MLIAGTGPSLNPDPWRFQPHPEVWLLVAFLVGAFIYAMRVIGPKVVTDGEVISRKQIWTFVLMITLLWGASDWPTHDIAEEYLYSVHMVQHMVLAYVVPPLVLLSTPEWMFRILIGEARTYRIVRFVTRPIFAAVAYNVVVMISHIPTVVNLSASGGPLHYFVHILVVSSALLMWMSVCGPIKEWRMSPVAKMIYLFSQSFVPVIPAAWLTVAEGPVYKHYNTPVRVGGISLLSDQQAAGVIMKLGGAAFIWTVIVIIFLKEFIGNFYGDQSYKKKDIAEPTPS